MFINMPKTTKLPMTKKINVVYNNEGTERVQAIWRIREKGDEKMWTIPTSSDKLQIQSHPV
jgi:hypothetical protein